MNNFYIEYGALMLNEDKNKEECVSYHAIQFAVYLLFD
jgi:hypothetical protein